MDFFYRYLISIIPTYILEISAVIAGLYFLHKKPKTPIINRYLVYFLWLTLFVEIIGSYAAIGYFTDYSYFGFVKDTLFERNIWLYNIYSLISFSFLGYYFNSLLQSEMLKKRGLIIIFLYFVIGIINLFVSDIFFIGDSIYTIIAGTILLLLIIIVFYFNLLQSNTIINLKLYLPLYISIGVLVYYLCVTPLDIFSQYFKAINKNYVNLKTNVLLFANIIMYGTFITGFIICAKSKNSKEELLN